MITPTQHPVGHPEGLCESWLAILQIFSYLKNSIFDFGNLKIYQETFRTIFTETIVLLRSIHTLLR